MGDKIEKINVYNDEIYIKKGWDGCRVVYPWKTDLERPFSFKDNINWKNFLIGGHWSRPFKMFLFLIVFYLFVQMYLSDTATCRDFVENFETRCSEYFETLIQIENITEYTPIEINFSFWNNTNEKSNT